MENTISSFRGENYFLSNMYPCEVVYNGVLFQTAEAAFQAAKCFRRAAEFAAFGKGEGRKAKSLGRKVGICPDWEQKKLRVMQEVVLAKFLQNADLMAKLEATGDARLVEGNTWGDRYWGICDGKGENHLGLILEAVRAGKGIPETSASPKEILHRLSGAWASRPEGARSITLDMETCQRQLVLEPVFREVADKDELAAAGWILVSGWGIGNVMEDEPGAVMDSLARYPSVLAQYDVDLHDCLRFARSKGNGFGNQDFTTYSDWYKSLLGERPSSWDSLERLLRRKDGEA